MKKFAILSAVIIILLSLGGVNASFYYSLGQVGNASGSLNASLNKFTYPAEGFDDDCSAAIDAIISTDNTVGGLNCTNPYTGTYTIKGLHSILNYASAGNRNIYGFVGTMDPFWGEKFVGIPSSVEVVVTVIDKKVENYTSDDIIYVYVAKKDRLSQTAFGQILDEVFRVKIEKIHGEFIQTECVLGTSEVVEYNYSSDYYDYGIWGTIMDDIDANLSIKSFALYWEENSGTQTIWKAI